MQRESARKGGPSADALYGPGGYENVTLRMESQESSTRKRISEELVRSALEAMERDARHASLNQNHQFQTAVREYQRQARDAVSHAVRESSESCEVMIMQEIQGVQNRL